MPRATPAPESVYQVKVTLRGVRPPIWRRIQVPGDITLARLHPVLQVVMGWTDSHLHQFIVGRQSYGIPDREYDLDTISERGVPLSRVAPAAKARLRYEYDFGDGWDHDLLVEAILPPEPGARYPVCLTGRRACPPEDCGGIWGYAGFLEAIRDPNHPEHEDMTEWIGGSFDSEEFDLEAINRDLKRLR